MKLKSVLFENKIEKFLARLIKRKTKTNSISDEKGEIRTDTQKYKRS